MADYLSGGISFAGIGNGTDFQSMIEQLKKIESIPKDRLEKSYVEWNKKYTAFEGLINTVREAESSLAKLSKVSSILKKEASTSNGDVAKVTASSTVPDGNYTLDVKQVATSSILSNNTIFDSKTTNINNTGATATFAYEYKGKTYEVEVPKDAELGHLTDIINKDPNNPGVKANLIKTGEGYMFSLEGEDTGAAATLNISNATTLPDFKATVSTSGALANGADTVINTSSVEQEFSFSHNGKNYTFTIPPGSTAKNLQDAINSNAEKSGVRASFVKDGDITNLRLEGNVPGEPVTVSSSPAELGGFTSSGTAGWNKRESQDAIFNVNGWPQDFTSATNKLTEVIAGLEITITGEGKTQISVTTSTEDTKKQIEEAVQSINDVLVKIQELTASKKPEVPGDDKDDKDSSSSTYKLQTNNKVGPFSGNSGIQLFGSRYKSILSSNGPGFLPKDTPDGPGDMFTSLASIGIVIDAEEGSKTFGQLKVLDREAIGPSSPFTTLDEALEKNPNEVVGLLAGMSGTSDSLSFSYEDQLPGTTKPGTYAVKYNINDDGTIGDVFIGGQKATLSDPARNVYTVASGDASGLSISIKDLTPGVTVESTVRLKQGKFGEIQTALKAETQLDPLKEKTGPLIIMQESYKETMRSLETQIKEETERLGRWERTQRLKFARLDGVLAKYDQMMMANAATLGQV